MEELIELKEKAKMLENLQLVQKTMEKSNGKKVVERRYYISSLLLDMPNFSNTIRKNWNVGNNSGLNYISYLINVLTACV